VPGNSFGNLFQITTFGESHGSAVGVVVDGCPAGLELSEQDIQPELDRRRPGQSKITSPRKEADTVQLLSGVYEGKTTGAPIAMMVWNQDQRSQDYKRFKGLFRPGHADYTFDQKYGQRDPRGGGRTSARIMIGRVAAGAIAKKFLRDKVGMEFLAYTEQVGKISMREKVESQAGLSPVSGISQRLQKLELRTERLLLKPISFEYLEDVYQNFTSEISTYMIPQPPDSISGAAEFVSDTMSKSHRGEEITLVILQEHTQEFMGLVTLFQLHTDYPEFGIWLKKEAQGKKFAQEAMLKVKRWAEENLNYKYLKYPVDKNNTVSQKLAEKMGGVVEAEYQMTNAKGQELNFLEYRIYPSLSSDSEIANLQKILEKLK
jgi:RimJ/RimL family protein N-acetyltransferase